MSKARQRRKAKLSKNLGLLARTNPQKFKKEWSKRLESWVDDVHNKGRRLRRQWSQRLEIEEIEMDLETEIFCVLRKAEELLSLCGSEVEALVGSQTRTVLSDECCRAFALSVEPRLYKLGNTHSNYLLMKAGTHRPRR